MTTKSCEWIRYQMIKGLLFLVFLLPFTTILGQSYPDEQTVSATLVNVSIDSALFVLSNNSQVAISYDPSIIPNKLVTLFVQNIKLGLALDNIFEGTDLKYQILGNQLIIKAFMSNELKKNYNISGIVFDSLSKERLVYANIFTDGAHQYGNISNEYGFYSISIPQDRYTLNFSFLGYTKQQVSFDLQSDTIIDVYLSPEQLMNEIIIRETIQRKSTEAEQSVTVPVDLLINMANIGGEPDVFRMLQMRAGVASFTDGFGGIQVRGGQSDHTLSLMDGVPIYNTGHMLGLFSVFHPTIVKSTRLLKAGVPARYGGRLSAILDVALKDGNKNKVAGEFSVSPLLIRGSLELPINKGKSSLLLAGRRTIIDPFLRPLSKYQFERNNEDGFINFYFFDFNAKFNTELGKNDQLFLSYYQGQDSYLNEVEGDVDISTVQKIRQLDVSDYSWGNRLASVKWNHFFGSKAFLTSKGFVSRFRFQNFEFDRTIINPGAGQTLGFNSQLYQSEIEDRGISIDLDVFFNANWKIRFGGEFIRHTVIPGADFNASDVSLLDENLRLSASVVRDNSIFPELYGQETRAYIENEIRMADRLTLQAGLHVARLQADNSKYTFFEPRLALSYRFGHDHFLRLAFTEMDQFMHVISTFGLGLPNDIWIPSTANITPQRARDWSVSFDFNFKSGYSWSLSAYTKELRNIYGFREGGIFAIQANENWEEQLFSGNGRSRGVEVELEKKLGIIRGFVSYTYSKSTRQFEEINDGIEFYANNDRRHQSAINLQTKINNNLDFSIGYTYNTGSPVTLPIAIQSIVVSNTVEIVPIYGRINNARLPAYHNLSMGLNVHNQYTWARQKFSLGVYNVYNRRNPFYIDLVKDPDNNLRFNLEQVSLMPLLPYISYSISF